MKFHYKWIENDLFFHQKKITQQESLNLNV